MSEKPYANGKSFANGTKVATVDKAEANVQRLGLADSVRYHGTRAVSARLPENPASAKTSVSCRCARTHGAAQL